jgi:flavin reductase (DIM6/NTAB) family NADH-FMN oxidoreductase RutF
MRTLDTENLSIQELQQYLQYAIAPRPICFASTIDLEGNVNVSPFSFFNLFSINPPICIFSPSRRVRDNSTKHTLENIKLVPECVINIVNYEMVQQVSLASCDFPKGINEFIKAGFTQLASDLVKPPRVAEAPIQLECIIQQVISLGENAGAGNLVIAEIKRIHIQENVLDSTGHIDPVKLDLVARLGGDWYARITANNLFKVEKPNSKIGIGFDKLPIGIQQSSFLTNNEKAQLANTSDTSTLHPSIQVKVYSNETLQKVKEALNDNNTPLAWNIIQTSV